MRQLRRRSYSGNSSARKNNLFKHKKDTALPYKPSRLKLGDIMNNTAKWVWLATRCGAGSTEIVPLLEKLGSIKDIYRADFDEYIRFGISERMADLLSDKALDEVYSIIEYCSKARVGILCYDDAKYPSSLRSLKDPPAVLYYAGTLPSFNRELCISVVGTRKMSEYGMRAAYKIAYETAGAGAVIVSGMALGIDSVASGAAIAAGGRTVAVLGCGIDVVYPKEHKTLMNAIRRCGAVITEYPPSTEPHSYNFPQRNRIISGLSQGTVVIDADLKSGAMITAKTAILQGRDIYAVPSNIDSENSSGTNSLIRDGAQAVLCGDDIIKNYAYLFRDTLNIQKLRSAEKRSDFDASVLERFGVRARGERAAYAGASAEAEKRNKSKFELFGGRTAEKAPPFKPSEQKNTSVNSEATTLKLATRTSNSAQEQIRQSGDNSSAALASLSELQRKIFNDMPLSEAITSDYLVSCGYDLKDVISTFTILEIKGLVSSLPGALYIRR